MHGNVSEWVRDCWNDNYSGVPTDGSARATGDCRQRVLRGGAWDDDPQILRSALRLRQLSVFFNSSGGFRLARTLAPYSKSFPLYVLRHFGFRLAGMLNP
jgi:formylglycine-generating enzyme required for sulfatase activity